MRCTAMLHSYHIVLRINYYRSVGTNVDWLLVGKSSVQIKSLDGALKERACGCIDVILLINYIKCNFLFFFLL